MKLPESLLQPFEADGYWWLPENEDRKVAGKLYYSPKDNIRIELLNPLVAFTSSPISLPTLRRHEYVFGEIETGHFVSVHNVLDQGISKFTATSVPFFKADLVSSGTLVLYENLQPYTQESWTHANIRITNQEAFTHEFAFQTAMNQPEKDSYIVTHIPPLVELSGLDCGEFLLSSSTTPTIPYRSLEEHVFSSACNYSIEFHSGQNIATLIRTANKLAVFLTLLIGDLQLVEELTCSFEHEEDGKSTTLRCRPLFVGQDASLLKYINTHQMLFHMFDFGDSFKYICKNFFTSYNKTSVAVDLFMSVLKKPNMYISFSFAALAQAVESLHAVLNGDCQYLSESLHKKFRAKLRDYYNETLADEFTNGSRYSEFVQSTNEAIRQANRFNFRSKCNDIFSIIDGDLIKLVTNDFTSLIGRIVNWRNDIAHGQFEIDDTNYLQFRRDFYALNTLMEARLLQLLEIDPALIASRLISKYSFLFSQLSTG